MALANPMLTQSEIGRAVGLSRQGVRLALKRDGIVVRDGRGERSYGRDRESRILREARRKMQAQVALTRDERHLVWQAYRHRERESAA